MQNAISMYSMWRSTPVSNLTHLAASGQFSIDAKLFPGTPEYEKKCSKK